jgi:thymidine phosphorylase
MPHSPATTRAAPQETAALTAAMKDSGRVCDLSDIPGPKVDKHSTGGVGASLGAVVPMMSGRGLGHTGGTLDKLESIPGFNVSLSTEEFKKVLRSCGAAIVGTTPDMAPADKKMYASPLPPLPQEIQYPRPNP